MRHSNQNFKESARWIGPALLLLAVLWYPISRVVMLHLTLTGACEEGLGYRYFYTLRLLYEGDGYIFLPQGHLMDAWRIRRFS